MHGTGDLPLAVSITSRIIHTIGVRTDADQRHILGMHRINVSRGVSTALNKTRSPIPRQTIRRMGDEDAGTIASHIRSNRGGGEVLTASTMYGIWIMTRMNGGGGACWSDFCFAFEAAGSEMPLMQVLNPNDPDNPFKEFSVAFLHYCDGSLFAGDVEYDVDAPGYRVGPLPARS